MTEEEKQKVIELWDQGLTGQAIGELIGVSRCSILGFISRQRKNGHAFKRPIEKNRSLRDNVFEQKVVKAKEAKKKKEKIKRPPKVKKVIVEEKPIDNTDYRVDLMGLKRISCRYPISADDAPQMIFCGKPQAHGSYCKEHGDICYYLSKYSLNKIPN